MTPSRDLPAIASAAALVVLAAALVAVAALEPVISDGWSHFLRARDEGLTPAAAWDVAQAGYRFGNPRIGQVLTFALHGAPLVHAIATPLVILATLATMTALVLGRWPSLRRRDDVVLLAVVAGMTLAAVPVVGAMLGYRPYTANYVYGFLGHLLLFVPYRVHAVAPRARSAWFALALGAWGAVAGMTNEHTGPASIAALAVAIALFLRRGDRLAAWMIAGVLGLLAGYLALYFAPGHDHRYAGLGRHDLVDVLVGRGASGNLAVLAWSLHALLVLPWLAVARGVRGRERALVVFVAATAAMMAVTAVVAPKSGARLFYAPVVLAVVAAAIELRPALRGRVRAVLVGLSTVVIAAHAVALVAAQHRRHGEFRARLAVLDRAPRGGVVAVPPYSIGATRWTIGDDFRSADLRARLAEQLGLGAIVIAPPERR